MNFQVFVSSGILFIHVFGLSLSNKVDFVFPLAPSPWTYHAYVMLLAKAGNMKKAVSSISCRNRSRKR